MQYLISLLIVLSMAFIEGHRIRTGEKINFLSAFNALFLVNFAIPPLMFAYVTPRLASIDPGGTLWIYPLMNKMGVDALDFMSASVWSLVSYAIISATYLALKKPAPALRLPDAKDIPNSWLVAVMAAFAIIAIVASAIYVDSVGGIQNATRFNASFRNDKINATILIQRGVPTTQYLFLIYFSLFIVPAFIFATAQVVNKRHQYSPLIIATIFWVLSIAVLVQRAGRLDIALFIMLLPMALYFRFPLKGTHIAGAIVFFAIIFYALAMVGDTLFFRGSSIAISNLLSSSPNIPLFMAMVLQEFSFPYMVLAHTVNSVPEIIEYRYFYDYVLAIQYMVPNLGAADQLPPTANMINGRLFGLPIPMDLLSHGMVYLGGAGLVIISIVFGGLLRLADNVFDPDRGWLYCLFRAWWMLYLPFRLMYGDPLNSMKSGFDLFAGTAVFAVIVVATHYRNRKSDQSPVL